MRYYYNRKATADESCRLKISYLRKRGMLTGEEAIEKIGWTCSMTGKKTSVIVGVSITNDDSFAILIYTLIDRDGKRIDYDYAVSLVTTPCNFGGARYWFGCPTCGRRVGVLYRAPGDVYFICRHCSNPAYNSRNRCPTGTFGHTWRQIDELRGQIKRRTWRGRPTRKIRRLQALERKTGVLSGPITARMKKRIARLR